MKPWVHDWVAYHSARQPDAPAVTCVESGVTVTWGACCAIALACSRKTAWR